MLTPLDKPLDQLDDLTPSEMYVVLVFTLLPSPVTLSSFR